MFSDRIKDQVLQIDREKMTDEEKAVMAMLYEQFIVPEGVKITQRQIAAHERWLGCHPQHEMEVVAVKEETTTRKVRQIIRDLRIKYQYAYFGGFQGLLDTTRRDGRCRVHAEPTTRSSGANSFME